MKPISKDEGITFAELEAIIGPMKSYRYDTKKEKHAATVDALRELGAKRRRRKRF